MIAAVCYLCLLAAPALAERKESLFGRVLEKTTTTIKSGAAAVKEDLDNYNSFIVTVDVDNRSNEAVFVEVWKPEEDEPELMRRVAAHRHKKWTFETRAYIYQRDYKLISRQGDKRKTKTFNPQKQDDLKLVIK
jgi:lipopolysaccharide export LptBFGC system permease protein LptF